MKEKYPWQDNEYLKNLALCYLGIEEKQLPKRYLKLMKDIISIRERLLCFCFLGSSMKARELVDFFTRDLREFSPEKKNPNAYPL